MRRPRGMIAIAAILAMLVGTAMVSFWLHAKHQEAFEKDYDAQTALR